MTKVEIISGFLGAGKTTLIKKLLNEEFKGENNVLVENEFGEIGIDGGFLKDAGIEIKEINSGCICCSLRGDFKEALKTVIDKYSPDRIIIEPSGVGKLSDIIDICKSIDNVEIHTYTTVVDATKCKVYAKNFGEFFNDQIKNAKCIVLAKTQGCTEDKLREDINIIREFNPKAPIITTPWEQMNGKDIYTIMNDAKDIESMLLEEDEHEHHHHHHDHDEEHECGCGHHHDHDEEHECECGHHHDHDEDHECGCEHHHDHDEEHECGCEHHHDHDEEHECGCGHHHDHEEGHEHHHHHHDHDADEVFTSVGYETVNTYTKEEIESILSKLDEHIIRAKGIVKGPDNTWLYFDYLPDEIDVREGLAAYTGLITVIGTSVNEKEVKELFRL